MPGRYPRRGRCMTKPRGIQYEPFLCPLCLHEGFVRRTWIDPGSLTLICSTHGAILTVQELHT